MFFAFLEAENRPIVRMHRCAPLFKFTWNRCIIATAKIWSLLSRDQDPGYFLYKREYTTHLHGNYNKPFYKDPYKSVQWNVRRVLNVAQLRRSCVAAWHIFLMNLSINALELPLHVRFFEAQEELCCSGGDNARWGSKKWLWVDPV